MMIPSSHCVVDAHLQGVIVAAQTGAVHPDSSQVTVVTTGGRSLQCQV